jgi:DNA repair protein RadD
MDWVLNNVEPCCIEAITSFGKSHLVAAVAQEIHRLSGKKVLCIQPSKELVEQNHAKYPGKASIYCASITKSLRHHVIFCTPMSIKPVARKLQCAAVILDEAHMITPTIMGIIDILREQNPNLRVIGLTSTPYRLGTGYIYERDEHSVTEAINPYFKKLVYRSDPRELLAAGYLCPIVIGAINADNYDVSQLEVKSGRYTADSVERVFAGHGRKTAAIIADVVAQSKNSRGVLIFAATVRHAEECLASLPHGSAIVTGSTPKDEREAIIRKLKAQRIKYVVNVACLTTGLDVTHIETIAILRATESSALLSQIIGRGMRIHEGKESCLVLDYAGNIDRHYPDGDIFKPMIRARVAGEAVPMEVTCPECGFVNPFSARKNDDGYPVDAEGYFTDLDGERVKDDEGREIPAHYGRRCLGYTDKRCEYRWSSKECPECEHQNDIAARYCEKCREELVDPNEKLIAEYNARKRDPHQVQTDEVLDLNIIETLTRKGDTMHVAEFTLERRTVKLYLPDLPYPSAQKRRDQFREAYKQGIKTITYHKVDDFWRVVAYNEAKDEAPC